MKPLKQKRNIEENILQLQKVTKVFEKGSKLFGTNVSLRAVNEVTLNIRRGEVLGLVGESGCGKSTLGRLILRLHEPTSGNIFFENEDITRLSQRRLRSLRRDLQIVFQDPYASLNPRMTVKEIIEKPFKVHQIPYSRETINTVMEMAGLNTTYSDRYPHEFSGGQRQRIGIARAIALNPKFIVCDEPVSALDVSVQAQVLNLLTSLKEKLELTYLFISHDLSVVKHISDRVAVMYLGNIVEYQDKESFYSQPLHPYSRALLSAIPIANPFLQRQRQQITLQGDLPNPFSPPSGCPFHPRCTETQQRCREEKPALFPVAPSRMVACHFASA